MAEHDKDASDPSRRGFMKVAIGALGAAGAATVAIPGAVYFLYPLANETTSGSDAFLPAGKPGTFPEGKPVKVDLFADRVDAWNRVVQAKVGSAWVIRKGDAFTAFSTVCPHFGCAIDWDEGKGKFKCPCHKSWFATDGSSEEGPSPRGLDELEVEAGEKLVAIRYQRFKQGVSEKEPV